MLLRESEMGLLVIDSSIWVAVMTGFPLRLAWLMIRFCKSGTSSGLNSNAKSPLATMTPSAISRILSKHDRTSGLSILAMTGIVEDRSARAVWTVLISSGLRTKERGHEIYLLFYGQLKILSIFFSKPWHVKWKPGKNLHLCGKSPSLH